MKHLFIILILAFSTTFVNAQDIIILKNNKKYNCQIIEIKKCITTFYMQKNVYKISSNDLKAIVINVSTKKGLKTARFFSKKSNCLSITRSSNGYMFFLNSKNITQEEIAKLNPLEFQYENSTMDLAANLQKGYKAKKAVMSFVVAGATSFICLLIYALILGA